MLQIGSRLITLIDVATEGNHVAYFDKRDPPSGTPQEFIALVPEVRVVVEQILKNGDLLYADVRRLSGEKYIVTTESKIGGETFLAYPAELNPEIENSLLLAARIRLQPQGFWELVKETGGVLLPGLGIFAFGVFGYFQLAVPRIWLAVAAVGFALLLSIPISRVVEKRAIRAAMRSRSEITPPPPPPPTDRFREPLPTRPRA